MAHLAAIGIVTADVAESCRFYRTLGLDVPEPPVRINTDLLDAAALDWDESAAWDKFTEYYAR